MTTPADIRFQEDEPDEEFDQVPAQAEPVSTRGSGKSKKKSPFPKWIFGLAALMLVLIIVFVSSLFTKKSPPTDTPIAQQVPQPVIREAQSAPRSQVQEQPQAPAAASQSYGAPQTQSAAAQAQPQAQQSVQPQDQQGPSAAVSANQADLIIKELTRINGALKALTEDVEKLKQGAAAQKPASAAPSPGANAGATAQKPAGTASAPPTRQQVARKTAPGKKSQDEIITYPPLHATYCVTGLVGTRAFIVKKNADGSETETSLVVGDRIDGVPVSKIDPATREVLLTGGQRITVSGAGCARDK